MLDLCVFVCVCVVAWLCLQERVNTHLDLSFTRGHAKHWFYHTHRHIYKHTEADSEHSVATTCCIYLCKMQDTSHDGYKACCPSGVLLHKRDGGEDTDQVLLFLHRQTKKDKYL